MIFARLDNTSFTNNYKFFLSPKRGLISREALESTVPRHLANRITRKILFFPAGFTVPRQPFGYDLNLGPPPQVQECWVKRLPDTLIFCGNTYPSSLSRELYNYYPYKSDLAVQIANKHRKKKSSINCLLYRVCIVVGRKESKCSADKHAKSRQYET